MRQLQRVDHTMFTENVCGFNPVVLQMVGLCTKEETVAWLFLQGHVICAT